MRLHRHAELVEAMARARATIDGFEWSSLSSPLQCDYIRNATAALDALLEAAVRLEVAKETKEVYGITYGYLTIRLEASDDK